MTASEPDKQREPWAFGWLVLSFAGVMLAGAGWFVPAWPYLLGTEAGAIANAVMMGIGLGMTMPAVRKLRGLGRVFALVLFAVALGALGVQVWSLAVRGEGEGS